MRFVQRDEQGKVIAHFACPQGYAAEELRDDHPDIEAFRARRRASWKPPAALHIEGTLRRSPFARGLLKVLARRLGDSEAALVAAIIAAAEEQPEPDTGAELDG